MSIVIKLIKYNIFYNRKTPVYQTFIFWQYFYKLKFQLKWNRPIPNILLNIYFKIETIKYEN